MESIVVCRTNNVKINNHTMNMLEREDVWLNDRKWIVSRMINVCPLMKEWKTKRLFLLNNDYPHILRELAPVRMESLIFINLMGNQIQSVEAISQLRMPSLSKLCLHANRIVNIQSFRKCHFQNLALVVVGHNLIQEGQSLAEMFLPSLNDLSIEYWQSNFQINDLSWMAKLQPSEIARIYIQHKSRIRRKGLMDRLQSKYPEMDIVDS